MFCGHLAFDGFAGDNSLFPAVWKASLFFYALSMTIMCLTLVFGLFSCCLQSLCKKSIFSMAGVAQSIAAITLVCGAVLYPWGWGSSRVQRLCGKEAAPFYMDDCQMGWPMYAAMAGIALHFAACGLSVCADRAAASDKVQEQMDEGRGLICLA